MDYPFQITNINQYEQAYNAAAANPAAFWADIAAHFTWRKQWDKVLDWNFTEPKIEWFAGGELNITENCLDRHLPLLGNTTALIWEPNVPEEAVRRLTYNELYTEVCRFAQALLNNGVKKGDRVGIYMGLVPELPIAMLACARIGAIHTVIFAGFSARSIADRLQDTQATFVITADGGYRAQKTIPLKETMDEALLQCPTVERVMVLQRTGQPCDMQPGRDVWWHDEVAAISPNATVEATPVEAEHPLFILYTSGSTGKPKGVVHTTAGYMVYTTYTFVNVFQYKQGDVHFCTADPGWITGHSYLLYAPLCAGATSLLYEGIPTWPHEGRLWEIIDKHNVNILYTAPTAIRSLMGYGTEPVLRYSLNSLRVLGTVGEPINEEAWQWYFRYVGKQQCPIVDTWWQTETGGILIANLANITPPIPTFATLPLPGIMPVLLDDEGNTITDSNTTGKLCIAHPWPGMIRTTYGDHERCRLNYFATYPGYYYTGDGAYRDDAGNYRITGRVDDVLNVSGHRIGTAEVEDAINKHPHIVESAVVGYPHPLKGQALYAFVVSDRNTPVTTAEIADTVAQAIGSIAKPDKIQQVVALPKTRSGKIMRRILRKIAEGDLTTLGDTTTLLDPSVVGQIALERIGE